MTVRDNRRAPFAWTSLEALRRIRQGIPASAQVGVRNAYLTLCEAASMQLDGEHGGSYTLGELAGLGQSERRLRPHLQALAEIGLVAIEAVKDEAGRDLPTRYALLDAVAEAGADGSSDPVGRIVTPAGHLGVDVSDKTSDPTRAGVSGQEEEPEEPLSSAVADEQESPDVARLCRLLADLIRANDARAKVAPDSKRWRTACRLLLTADGRSPEEIERVMRWALSDSFWRSVVLSMPKLRDKFGQLVVKAGTAASAGSAGAPPDFSKYDQPARSPLKVVA